MIHLGKHLAAGFLLAFLVLPPVSRGADEHIFSGPQVGESVTAFKVVDVTGPSGGKERSISAGKETASVFVFVHRIERSIVPLLTTVDEYASDKQDSMKTEFVFLTDDRVASAKRLPLVGQSLRIRRPMSMSIDGPEGPGNWGLDKRCLMTIVVTKEAKVTANFALVQPGIADAPAVIAAMAKACGDANPPSAETLGKRRNASIDEQMRQHPAQTRPASQDNPRSPGKPS